MGEIMKHLIVLGFDSRELADEARRRGEELDRQGVLDLEGAALAYRREDNQIELVQPLRLAREGTLTGAAYGGLLGLAIVAPLLGVLLGAGTGAAGAGLAAGILNALFVRDLQDALAPGRAALFLVVEGGTDPSTTIDALRPLSPRVLRTNLDDMAEQRLVATFTGAAADDWPKPNNPSPVDPAPTSDSGLEQSSRGPE
jgi:uncharacterized membrane protein